MYYLEINQLSMFHTSANNFKKTEFLEFKSVKISIINSAILSLFYFIISLLTVLPCSDLKIINAC